MKHSIKCLLCLLVVLATLSGTVLATMGNYPYEEWSVSTQSAEEENTTSRGGTVWKTLRGSVTAEELSFGELRYWVYLPETCEQGKSYPMVVYLHGSTASYQQSKYSPWLLSLNKSAYRVPDGLREALGDCILFVPQAPSTKAGTVSGSAWSNMGGGDWKTAVEDRSGASNYLKAAEKLMADYIAKGVSYQNGTYAVDRSRVYLIGESMGGIGAYAMLQDCPDVFAAVMIRAGIGDPGAVASWKDTPIRVFHGTLDANVKHESSVRMIDALNAANAKDAQLISVENGAHEIQEVMYRTMDEQGNNVYLTWLSRQSRPDTSHSGAEECIWLVAAVSVAVILAVWLLLRRRRSGKKA